MITMSIETKTLLEGSVRVDLAEESEKAKAQIDPKYLWAFPPVTIEDGVYWKLPIPRPVIRG